MIPFGVPIIIRHLLFRVPQKGTLILTTTHTMRNPREKNMGLSFFYTRGVGVITARVFVGPCRFMA